MKIAILVPSHDTWPALFGYDLAQLQATTLATLPPETQVGLYVVTGTYIHQARQQLLEQALSDGATHVLWIDSDMRFPPDALLQLLERDEPVVGINYAQRGMPTDFVAFKHVPEAGNDPGEKLATWESSTGTEPADAIGFGLVLMRADALDGLPDPDETPWFWFEQRWPGDNVGEDTYFWRLLRDTCDVRPLVDHDLSRKCGHIGSFAFTTAHAALERDA